MLLGFVGSLSEGGHGVCFYEGSSHRDLQCFYRHLVKLFQDARGGGALRGTTVGLNRVGVLYRLSNIVPTVEILPTYEWP